MWEQLEREKPQWKSLEREKGKGELLERTKGKGEHARKIERVEEACWKEIRNSGSC